MDYVKACREAAARQFPGLPREFLDNLPLDGDPFETPTMCQTGGFTMVIRCKCRAMIQDAAEFLVGPSCMHEDFQEFGDFGEEYNPDCPDATVARNATFYEGVRAKAAWDILIDPMIFDTLSESLAAAGIEHSPEWPPPTLCMTDDMGQHWLTGNCAWNYATDLQGEGDSIDIAHDDEFLMPAEIARRWIRKLMENT